MSLLQKLTQDRLQRNCQVQVQELHQLFVHWFLGTRAKEELQQELQSRLMDHFSHVAPNGQFLKGRQNLIQHLDEKYGCYGDRMFQIDIYNVQLLWTDGSKCLCTYEEWQSWQQEEGNGQEVDQFGRLSTCLLEQDAADGKFRWIHVHETWLEAESPEQQRQGTSAAAAAAATSNWDDDTVMTGPFPFGGGGGRGILAGTAEESETSAAAADENHILLLVSNQIISKTQKADQEMTYQMFQDHNIGYDILDGSNPSQRDERNELFKISRVWGKYPQIFLIKAGAAGDDDEKPTYWGNVVKLLESVDQGTLRQDLELAPAAVAAAVADRDMATATATTTTTLANGGSAAEPTDTASPPAAAIPTEPPAPLEPAASESPQRHVLVLISEQSLSRDQTTRQENAFSELQEARIPYKTLDGGEPDNRWDRNELFKLSQSWGIYPQFFLVNDDGRGGGEKEFWGGHDRFETSSEGGTLRFDMGFGEGDPKGSYDRSASVVPVHDDAELKGSYMHSDSIPVSDAVEEPDVPDDEAESVPVPATTDTVDKEPSQQPEPSIKREEKKEVETPAEEATSSSTGDMSIPVPTTFTGEDRILILVSKERVSDEQVQAQKQAFAALPANNIPFDTIDGSDPGLRARRNELFRLSGSWGQYPQFFYATSKGQTTSWGGKERFAESLEKGTLREDMGFDTAKDSSAAESLSNEEHIVLLTSSALGDQAAYQEQVYTELSAVGVPCEKIDGSVPDNMVKRNELFRLSQSWGKYPQVFKVAVDGTTTFWGGRERFDDSLEKGTLSEDLGLESGAQKSLQREPSVKFSSTRANPETASSDGYGMDTDDESLVEEALTSAEQQAETDFLNASQGILEFEEDVKSDAMQKEGNNGNISPPSKRLDAGSAAGSAESTLSPIPHDVSSKRHISPKLEQYAKPLTWENVLVGVSISGFDVGTSQGPIGDSLWYQETGDILEDMAQPREGVHPRRKIALPEMVFPTAHVALEGHGIWLSFDVNDALEEWAQAHKDIPIHSNSSYEGVSVQKSKDAQLWDQRNAALKADPNSASVFHYDWTYSTPFAGKLEGSEWVELDESGMRTELLTDQTVPILFFDEIVLFEDDLHDNGQSQYSVKLRVMPSCAYVLARLWVRVDNVLVRMRETRLMVDFFGLKPSIYRDVTWRECQWESLAEHDLPTQVKLWNLDGRETPAWAAQLKKIPEVEPPAGLYKFAVME